MKEISLDVVEEEETSTPKKSISTKEEETYLTVLRTSMFFDGDGFTVYDCTGDVVFRVESYGPCTGDSSQIVLMDASGHCLLTVRRKRVSLHQRWDGFVGDRIEGQKPIFSVRRSSMIGRSSTTVEFYGDSEEEYQIEGSFGHRDCRILNGDKVVVGEIKRKLDISTEMIVGKEAFALSLKPGFDAAFAMGLVVVLDQIDAEDYDPNDGGDGGAGAGSAADADESTSRIQ
ncbi:hypothetical protein LguiB_023151 [Lonicera macranthoides]